MRHMKYLEKEVPILKWLQMNIINLKCVHASLLSDKSFNIYKYYICTNFL